jgi:hypothetical protein
MKTPASLGHACVLPDELDADVLDDELVLEEQVALVRVSTAVQLCEVPIPPQSIRSCDMPAFHVPTQPERCVLPNVTMPFMKSPFMSSATVPLTAVPLDPWLDESSTSHLAFDALMHCEAVVSRSPQPCPKSLTE